MSTDPTFAALDALFRQMEGHPLGRDDLMLFLLLKRQKPPLLLTTISSAERTVVVVDHAKPETAAFPIEPQRYYAKLLAPVVWSCSGATVDAATAVLASALHRVRHDEEDAPSSPRDIAQAVIDTLLVDWDELSYPLRAHLIRMVREAEEAEEANLFADLPPVD